MTHPPVDRKPEESHARKWWVGGCLGILTTAVSLWFSGPLEDVWSSATRDDDAERVVRQMLDDLRSAGDAGPSDRPSVIERARSLTTDAVTDPMWAKWDVGPDPYVWSELALDSGDETRHRAVVGPAGAGPWALRRAKSGCWELRGNFILSRTRGAWRITRLPTFHNRCRSSALRATWTRGDRERGVIGWTGSHQRVDPVSGSYSHRADLIEQENFERVWSPEKSFDVPDPSSGRDLLPYDGTLSTAWGVRQPLAGDAPDSQSHSWGTLTYTFPAEVQLLRIRLHNGVKRNPYEKYGRIKKATILAGGTAVEISLRDRIGSQRIDCAFGTVRSISLTVTDVWPAAGSTSDVSDVALSQIDFWGMPRGARIAAPPPSGPFAWSDEPRAAHVEDVAECRADPPPEEAAVEPVSPGDQAGEARVVPSATTSAQGGQEFESTPSAVPERAIG